LAAGIRRVDQTWSTRRPAAPTPGAGRLAGHPGRRLSLRRVFAESCRRLVWLTNLVDRSVAADRRLLRHLERRPTTAAAMTPGSWRLSIPRIAPCIANGIDLRVMKRTGRRWRLFRHGFICYSCSLRSCRRRRSTATPAPASPLEGFAV
jgi:hypothetical protein